MSNKEKRLEALISTQVPLDGGPDVFLHLRDIPDFELARDLTDLDVVAYELVPFNGKTKATRLVRVSPSGRENRVVAAADAARPVVPRGRSALVAAGAVRPRR